MQDKLNALAIIAGARSYTPVSGLAIMTGDKLFVSDGTGATAYTATPWFAPEPLAVKFDALRAAWRDSATLDFQKSGVKIRLTGGSVSLPYIKGQIADYITFAPELEWASAETLIDAMRFCRETIDAKSQEPNPVFASIHVNPDHVLAVTSYTARAAMGNMPFTAAIAVQYADMLIKLARSSARVAMDRDTIWIKTDEITASFTTMARSGAVMSYHQISALQAEAMKEHAVTEIKIPVKEIAEWIDLSIATGADRIDLAINAIDSTMAISNAVINAAIALEHAQGEDKAISLSAKYWPPDMETLNVEIWSPVLPLRITSDNGEKIMMISPMVKPS